MGRAKGIDVEGVDPSSGRRLAVECKGETYGANQWDTAWRNAAEGIIKVLRATERRRTSDDFALALPDTRNYQKRLDGLKEFCARQHITVFWVGRKGRVIEW